MYGICYSYLRGACDKGSKCRYLHDPSRSGRTPGSQYAGSQVCTNFMRGMCSLGESCYLAHVPPERKDIGNYPRNMLKVGICHAFLLGNCTRGDSCQYLHEMELIPSSHIGRESYQDAIIPSEMLGYQSITNQNRQVGNCFAFQRGECDRGSSCKYSHDLTRWSNEMESRLPQTGYRVGVCFAYIRGQCVRGDSCRYSHDIAIPNFVGGTCFAYQRGECARGNTCRYSHDISTLPYYSSGDDLEERLIPNEVCINFQCGRCERGALCPFLHTDFVITS